MITSTDDSDRSLLEAWAAGDRRAAQTLMARYEPRVRRFFASKTVDCVDDLTQATLLGCLEARKRFRGMSQFSTFLFAVARNKLFEHYRRKRKLSARTNVGASSVIDLGPSPSSILTRNAWEQRLVLALNELSLDAQITLELYYWEKMTAPEMASVLGIKEPGVRSRLRRAKEQLRTRFELGVEPGPEPPESLDDWAESVRGLFDQIAASSGASA